MNPELRAVLLSVESLPPEDRQQLLSLLSGDTFDFEGPGPVQSSPPADLSPGDSTPGRSDLATECPGRYSTREAIGSGGSGNVTAVHDAHLNRVVARKELHVDGPGAGSVTLTDRFLREARVTAQLEHPSIVPVYELGRRASGKLYYTMKRVRGKGLDVALRDCKGLPERMALLGHFVDLCQAIAYAHARGVVHRDIKPMNVMIGEFGETVVLDWGLARAAGQRDINADELKRTGDTIHDLGAGRTVHGSVFGTPAYMSPEQALGWVEKIDARSDVWSLGAVLHEILTGHAPYVADDVFGLLRKAAVGVVDPLPREVPADLAAIAMRAVEADPEQRYPSARELAEEVEAWRTGGQVGAYSYSSVELVRRFLARNRAVVAVVGVGVVVAVAAALASYAQLKDERDRAMAAESRTTLALADARLRGLLARAKEEEMKGDLGSALALVRAGVEEEGAGRVFAPTEMARLLAAGAEAWVFPGGFEPASLAVYGDSAAFVLGGRMVVLNTNTGEEVCTGTPELPKVWRFSKAGNSLLGVVSHEVAGAPPRFVAARWDPVTCAFHGTPSTAELSVFGLQQWGDPEAADDAGRFMLLADQAGERYLWDSVAGTTTPLVTHVRSPIRLEGAGVLRPGRGVLLDVAQRWNVVASNGSVAAAAASDSPDIDLWAPGLSAMGGGVTSPEPIQHLVAPGPVDALAIAPDGSWVVALSVGGVDGWDAAAGWARVHLGDLPGATQLAAARDAVVLAGPTGIRVLDVATGALRFSDERGLPPGVRLQAVDPDGSRAWLSGPGNLPLTVDLGSGVRRVEHPGIRTGVESLVVDWWGTRAVITPEGWLRVADSRDADTVRVGRSAVSLLSVAGDGGLAVAATLAEAVGWDHRRPGEAPVPLPAPLGALCEAAWSDADGAFRLAWATRCRIESYESDDQDAVGLSRWPALRPAEPGPLAGVAGCDRPTHLSLSPDGAGLVATDGGGCGDVRSGTGRSIARLGLTPRAVAFSGGALAMSVVAPGGVQGIELWRAGADGPQAPMGAPTAAAGSQLCFLAPDRLVTADYHSRVQAWDVATMTPIWSWQGDDLQATLTCSADHALLIGPAGQVHLLDRDGQLARSWPASEDPVIRAVLSPDGERLATATEAGHLRLRDVRRGGVLADLADAGVGRLAVVFTADGSQLLAGGEDGVVRYFDAPAFDAQAVFRATGTATNLRVCRDSLDVVPVLPYPAAETVWAPEAACGTK